MKYIMAEGYLGGMRRKVPLIFPSSLVHKIIAQDFEGSLVSHGYRDVLLVSAGDVMLLGAGLVCRRSTGLYGCD